MTERVTPLTDDEVKAMAACPNIRGHKHRARCERDIAIALRAIDRTFVIHARHRAGLEQLP